MDSRAQHRVLVLNHVLADELTADEAATYLQLSLRQVRRLLARHRGPEGVAALVTNELPSSLKPDDLLLGVLAHWIYELMVAVLSLRRAQCFHFLI